MNQRRHARVFQARPCKFEESLLRKSSKSLHKTSKNREIYQLQLIIDRRLSSFRYEQRRIKAAESETATKKSMQSRIAKVINYRGSRPIKYLAIMLQQYHPNLITLASKILDYIFSVRI